MKIDTVTICSGGLDSSTLLYLLREEGRQQAVVTFDYGQRHRREIDCARYHAWSLGLPHRVVDLRPTFSHMVSALLEGAQQEVPTIEDVLGDPQPPTYVPFRNQIFLSVACGIAESLGAQTVAYGAQRHDLYGYWDTTDEFIERFQSLIGLNRKTSLTLYAAFVGYSKEEIVREGLRLGVNFRHTWSCYRGGSRACGRCPTCSERLAAFSRVGVPDPLEYDVT